MTKQSAIEIIILALGLLISIGYKRANSQTSYQEGRVFTDRAEYIKLQNPDVATLHAAINKCYLLQEKGENRAAIDCYENVLRTSRETGYPEASAIICHNLIGRYLQEQCFEEANNYRAQFKMELNRIPSLFYNSNMRQHRWLMLKKDFEKAVAYYESGSFDTAIHLYLNIINGTGPAVYLNYQLLSGSYAALGAIYSHLGDHNLALFYFEKCNLLGKQFSDTDLIISSLNNKASTLHNYNYPDKALSIAREALEMAQSTNNLKKESEAAAVMAVALIKLHRPEEALPYSTMRLQTAQQLSLKKNSIAHAYNLLGYNYNQLKEYKRAEHYLLTGLALIKNLNDWANLENVYSQLSETYEGMGQYANALQYKKEYIKIRDSIRSTSNAKRIANVEVRYRVAQKDKELAQKDKFLAESKAVLYQQRNWLIGSIGLGLLFLVSLVAFLRNSRHKHRLHQEQLQSLQQQNTIEHLQVKMEAEEEERKRIARELHDGLGVLLSAARINHTLLGKVLPASGQSTTAYNESAQILQQMQQEIKTITNNLMPDYITHKSFEDALEILAARFNRPGTFHIHLHTYGIVQDLHPDRSFSLFRVIEEIIHNAVKHSGGTELIIQLMYHPDQLHITIEDNGIGFNTEHSYTGMGLQNIRNRIKLLNGYLSLVSDKERGTTYTLEIPYKNQ